MEGQSDTMSARNHSVRPAQHKMLCALLRLAENIAIAFSSKGSVVVFEFGNLERHWTFSEEILPILSCFRANEDTRVRDAITVLSRAYGESKVEYNPIALLDRIRELVDLGILKGDDRPQGPYSGEMCAAYCQAREMPPEISKTIVSEARITRNTRVLDIGTGPGGIANSLGMISHHVVGCDISDTFLDLAKSRAQAMGSRSTFRKMDGNKLIFNSEVFDVVIASQVFHWLEPSLASRGIYRGLAFGGSLFIVETKPVLDGEHPLRKILGFGELPSERVQSECFRHVGDYQCLFGSVRRAREHQLDLSRVWIFRERRTFDLAFARGYFFDSEIRSTLPLYPNPWEYLQTAFDQSATQEFEGDMYWMIIRFTKEAYRYGSAIAIDIPFDKVQEI